MRSGAHRARCGRRSRLCGPWVSSWVVRLALLGVCSAEEGTARGRVSARCTRLFGCPRPRTRAWPSTLALERRRERGNHAEPASCGSTPPLGGLRREGWTTEGVCRVPHIIPEGRPVSPTSPRGGYGAARRAQSRSIDERFREMSLVRSLPFPPRSALN